MTPTTLIGATGLVGSHILTTLLALQSISQVNILSRRSPPTTHQKLSPFIESDSTKWGPHIKSLTPTPEIFFSGLATTRGAVGGFDNQYKIDHDMNLELAKAAKESGTKVYVLISVAGASSSSPFAYTKMKGELEEHVKELGFERTVFVRPGLINGDRQESRPQEAAFQFVANMMGKVHPFLKESWAQDADYIAKASVKAGLLALEGKTPKGSEKVWIVSGSDIIRMGKKEWDDGSAGKQETGKQEL
ncbi:Protein fmp52, mitochondrial [Arachnomyces sp. PD_36]|nr:Protein fmp52, mitochondrial [Arachnomyces sp. PD_36]